MKIYITVDVEEDQWGDYTPARTSVENVASIPVVQELFDRYGAKPTYLVNYPVATGDASRQVMREILQSGRCGIGAHCHPWNTPPIREELSNHNSMLCNLPHALVHDKLEVLHQAIIDAWGVTPRCFRAGRWGFGEAAARSIHELGYQIDTSVTPFNDWSDFGGPDFSHAPDDEYLFRPDDILTPDPGGGILEVPPTVGFIQSNFRRCLLIRKWIASSVFLRCHVLGILDNLQLLNFRWLSPELCSGEDMVSLARTCIRNGSRSLNMSFHSTSIVPGLGPFVRSKGDVERFLRNIAVFLQFARDSGFEFCFLDEAAASSGVSPETRPGPLPGPDPRKRPAAFPGLRTVS